MSNASIDATAEALARRLLKDLPGHQPVARDAFDRLPAPVAQLLHTRIDARIDREASLPMTPWLDRDHADVREAQATWREAARTAARVPADAWEDLLADTAHLAIAHLVQPAVTLAAHAFTSEHAFDDTEPLPTPLVLERLRAFGPYPYLIEIVERYVEKKGLGHIDRDGLERLLLRIDSRMVAGFSADEWTSLLAPLFDLLGGTVPASVLHLAFETRGHHPLVSTLEGNAITPGALYTHLRTELATDAAQDDIPETEDSHQLVPDSAVQAPLEPVPELAADSGTAPETVPEPEAIDKSSAEPIPPPSAHPTMAHSFEVEPRRPDPTPPVIGSKFNAPEEVAPDDSDILGPARPVEIVAPMTPMTPLDTHSPTITDAVVTETMEGTTSPDDQPLWKRLAGTDAEAPLPPSAPAEATPLWAQFSQETPAPPIASSAPSHPVEPTAQPTLRNDASLETLELAVFGASDPDRRAWYIAELFSGNADDYQDTLRQLDAARTWTEATEVIAKDVFRKHSVNIYSDPAVTFTDGVEAAMEARHSGTR